MKVTQIKIQVLGERNFPEVFATLTTEQSRDLAAIVEAHQALNPATTAEDVIRAIWRLGSRRVQEMAQRRTPVRVEALPGVKPMGVHADAD